MQAHLDKFHKSAVNAELARRRANFFGNSCEPCAHVDRDGTTSTILETEPPEQVVVDIIDPLNSAEVVVDIPPEFTATQDQVEEFAATQPQNAPNLSTDSVPAGSLSLLRKVLRKVSPLPTSFNRYAETVANKVVEKLSDRLDKLSVSQVDSSQLEESQKSLLEMNLRKAESLQAILVAFDLEVDHDSGTCACRVCKRNSHAAQETNRVFPGGNRDKVGCFTLPASSDIRNFKWIVKKHFQSAAHTWCVEHQAWEDLQSSRRMKTALIIARNAYFIIREALRSPTCALSV